MKHKIKPGAYCFVNNPNHFLLFENLIFLAYANFKYHSHNQYAIVKQINTSKEYLVNPDDLVLFSQE